MLTVNTIVNSIFVNLQLTSHLTDYIVLCADEELTADQSRTLSEWAQRPLYQPEDPSLNIVVDAEVPDGESVCPKHNSGRASEASGSENDDGSRDASNRSSDEFDSDKVVHIFHNTPKTTQRRSRDSNSDDVGPLPSSNVGSSRPQRSQRPRYQEPEVDDNGWQNSCHTCGKSSGTLMECEFGLNGGDHAVCSRSYHAKCAGLSHVPDGEFVCPKHNSGHASEASGSEYDDDSDVNSETDLGEFVNHHKLR